jgi:hypothetical protein
MAQCRSFHCLLPSSIFRFAQRLKFPHRRRPAAGIARRSHYAKLKI